VETGEGIAALLFTPEIMLQPKPILCQPIGLSTPLFIGFIKKVEWGGLPFAKKTHYSNIR
jgi:hypothetical protein